MLLSGGVLAALGGSGHPTRPKGPFRNACQPVLVELGRAGWDLLQAGLEQARGWVGGLQGHAEGGWGFEDEGGPGSCRTGEGAGRPADGAWLGGVGA